MASALPLLLLGVILVCLLPYVNGQSATCRSTCLNDTDCDRGVCTNFTCHCEEKYDCDDDATGVERCSYKRKSRVAAFCLSFFLGGFGADRFYLLYGGIGALKLCLNLVSCCMCIPIVLLKKSGFGTALRVLNGILALGLFGWWLADVIMIGTGKLKDRRGHKTFDNM